MRRTYVDAGVLIAAATGRQPFVQPAAIAVLDDPNRVFLSSAFVRLEVLPKAVYHQNADEVAFYETFFGTVSAWAGSFDTLIDEAYRHAYRAGLAGMDALHVAAAASLGADELVTAERIGTPLLRAHLVRAVSIVSIHPTAARPR